MSISGASMFGFFVYRIPLFERHTGEEMLEVLVCFLDAVLPSWRMACIAVATDGARSMTGCLQGVVTRIQEVCAPGPIRIWCCLHQLALVMQRLYKPALEGEFYKMLMAHIIHFRRQGKPITEIKTTYPKVSDVRWISMDSVSTWLVRYRARVLKHLDAKQPFRTPNIVWWVFLHALQAFARESKAAFVSLQGLSTTVSEQCARLNQLVDTYCRMVGKQGPLSPEEKSDKEALQ
jgi:hypothetical protein